ncbi:hypothetical protein TFLX_03127 [Thermoflexales bacterium]|nr:hypothetical protein TFLX_03127 [Thermoflexales bacterium]
MTKLGVHVASSKRDLFGEIIDAGPACVVATDQYVSSEVRQRSAGTIIAFRTQKSPLGEDNPPGLIDAPEAQWRSIADAWMNSLWPFYLQNNGADYYIVNNELDVSTLRSAQALNAFYLRCMEIAEERGVRIGICSFSTGCPSDDGGLTLEERWALLLPAVAKAQQGGHVIVLHIHALTNPLMDTGEDIAFRHERSLRYFEQHGLHPKVIIGELSNGVGGIEPELDSYMQQVTAWDSRAMSSRWSGQLLGAALYGFNAGETLTPAATKIAEWIRSHPTPIDPPPPIRTYERVCHLVPPNIPTGVDEHGLFDPRYLEILRLAGPGRESVLSSADDAFAVVPQCTARTVYVYDVGQWGGRDYLEQWVREWYAPLPKVIYRELV